MIGITMRIPQWPIWLVALLISVVSVVAGMGLLLIAANIESLFWRDIIKSTGALVITGGLFSWWGAFLGKLELTRFVEERFGLARDLDRSGIVGVDDWKIDIPRGAKEVDILLIRGHAWFKMQAQSLRQVLKDGKTVRICLVHPKSLAIQSLAAKFAESEDEVRKKIGDTAQLIRSEIEAAAKAGELAAKVAVKAHMLPPTHTYYKFDEQVTVAWYAIRRGRHDVPALRLAAGSLGQFFRADFEGCWNDRETRELLNSEEGEAVNAKRLQDEGIVQP